MAAAAADVEATIQPGRRPHIPGSQRWIPRAAVLGSLAVATIAMPLIANSHESGPDLRADGAVVTGPRTLQVIAQGSTAPPISAAVAAPQTVRILSASRSDVRDPLPGCDPDTKVTSSNGHLTARELCKLPEDGEELQPAAASAWASLNEAFRVAFGRDVCLVSSYRSAAQQASVRAKRGSLAAAPGKSMHGWGLAIDLCSSETSSREIYAWLNTNGEVFGWANPSWAKRGGGGKYEPWHFEYTEGVRAVGGEYKLKNGRLSAVDPDGDDAGGSTGDSGDEGGAGGDAGPVAGGGTDNRPAGIGGN